MIRRLLLPRRGRDEAGQTLLVVLIIMIAVAVSSTSFIWFMNQQQTRAGTRYRAAAAFQVAQAGLRRALAILESTAPDGSPGRDWRPADFSEPVAAGSLEGRYVIAIENHPEWGLLVTSEGQAGGLRRRIRAHVVLAPPALLAGIYASASIRLVGEPASLVITPYGGFAGRPWVHIAAGGEVWFGSDRIRVNDPAGALPLPPGPIDPLAVIDRPESRPAILPISLLLAGEAPLVLGEARREVDAERLRAAGIGVAAVHRIDALPPLPEVVRGFYASLAEGNTANAALNRAAGRFSGDHDLEQKEDSRYDAAQMTRLLTYLNSRQPDESLRGAIYVSGRVTVPAGGWLHILDGALVTENTVKVEEEAELRVTHSARTRLLPGIIVLDPGGLVVGRGARLHAHGLVEAAQIIEMLEDATVEVVGAVAARASGLSLRNTGAAILLRYDAAVLATPGLRVRFREPIVAWVATWEEISP